MRTRAKDFVICLGFVLISVPVLLAQADEVSFAQSSRLGAPQPVLQARLVELPALAAADESALPDAPSVMSDDDASVPAPAPAPAPKPSPAKKVQQGAPGAASVGSLGVDSRVATGKYWGLTAGMFGASVADAELTVRCQQQKTCSYVPPSLRSRTALYGIGIPADVGISYLTYKLKQRSMRFWYVPSAFVTFANVYVGIHAYRRSQQTP